MDLKKFDKRTVSRNLEKGVVGAKEYEKYLSSLPDLEDNYDIVDIPLYDDEGGEGSEQGVDETPIAKEDTVGGNQPQGE